MCCLRLAHARDDVRGYFSGIKSDDNIQHTHTNIKDQRSTHVQKFNIHFTQCIQAECHSTTHSSMTPTTPLIGGVPVHVGMPSLDNSNTNPKVEPLSEGTPTPWPLKHTFKNAALSLSDIQKETLQSTDKVLTVLFEGKKELQEEEV